MKYTRVVNLRSRIKSCYNSDPNQPTIKHKLNQSYVKSKTKITKNRLICNDSQSVSNKKIEALQKQNIPRLKEQLDNTVKILFDELYEKNAHCMDTCSDLIHLSIFNLIKQKCDKQKIETTNSNGTIFYLHGEQGSGKTTIVQDYKNNIEKYWKDLFEIKIFYWDDYTDWCRNNRYSRDNDHVVSMFYRYLKQIFITDDVTQVRLNVNERCKIYILDDFDDWFPEQTKLLSKINTQKIEKIIGRKNSMILSFSKFNSFFLLKIKQNANLQKLIKSQVKGINFENGNIRIDYSVLCKLFQKSATKWISKNCLNICFSKLQGCSIKIQENEMEKWINASSVYFIEKSVIQMKGQNVRSSKNNLVNIVKSIWENCRPNLQKFKYQMNDLVCDYKIRNSNKNDESSSLSIGKVQNLNPMNICSSLIDNVSICFNTKGFIVSPMSIHKSQDIIERIEHVCRIIMDRESFNKIIDNMFRYYVFHPKVQNINKSQEHNMIESVSTYMDHLSWMNVYDNKMWQNRNESDQVGTLSSILSRMQVNFINDLEVINQTNNNQSIDFVKCKKMLSNQQQLFSHGNERYCNSENTLSENMEYNNYTDIVLKSQMGKKINYEILNHSTHIISTNNFWSVKNKKTGSAH